MHEDVQRLRKRQEKTGRRDQIFSMPRNPAHWLYVASQRETVLVHFQGSVTGKGGQRTAVEVTPNDTVLITRQTQAPGFMSPFPFKAYRNPFMWTEGYFSARWFRTQIWSEKAPSCFTKIILDSSCSVFLLLTYRCFVAHLNCFNADHLLLRGKEKGQSGFSNRGTWSL